MAQPNPFASKRKKMVGYILQFVGLLMALAGAAWSLVTLGVLIHSLIMAPVGLFLALIGIRLVESKWIIWKRRETLVDLRQRMRLVSLLFLVGYPIFVIFFLGATSVYHAYLGLIYWLFAFPVGIVLLVISFVMGRRSARERSDNLIRIKSIEIWARPEKVWEMFAVDKWAEWDEGTQKLVRRVEHTSEIRTPKDKYRVGATANFIDKNDKMYLASEVTESLENEKITYRLRADKHPFVHQIAQTFVLEPVEKGTKLTSMMNYEKLGWGILGKTIIKLMTAGKGTEKVLENLKSILEK